MKSKRRTAEAVVRLRVQPNAKRTAFVGAYGDALKVAVAAVPEDGKANAALADFLAETFGLPRSAVRLLRGASSRDKTFALDGLDPSAVQAILERTVATPTKERRCQGS